MLLPPKKYARHVPICCPCMLCMVCAHYCGLQRTQFAPQRTYQCTVPSFSLGQAPHTLGSRHVVYIVMMVELAVRRTTASECALH
jgi:hypothetical protein